MRTASSNNTNLSDDIQQIVVNENGEKLEMVRLCKDHYDPLLHNDNKPILNVTQDEFVGIFDLNLNHYFLSLEQIFRLGSYCRLALPNLIALMLKAEWEGFISKMSGYTEDASSSLKTILSDRDLIEMYISEFNPDNRKIFNLINDASIDSMDKTSYGLIEFYIRDLLERNNFLIETKQVNDLYSKTEITEKILLFKIPKTQRANYLRLKQLWKYKSEELEELLLFLERKKRLNLGVENKYFKTFGLIEAEKSKHTYNVAKYNMILDLMQDQPELSYRELHKLAVNKLIEADKERTYIINKISRSLNYIGDICTGGSISTASNEFRNDYMKACKKLLRKLFFLLHSDTCPNYIDLSQYKKNEINKLWLAVMKSTKEELYSYSPSMLLYSLPDYEHLVSIYKRVCEILDINPDDFEIGNRLEFMISKGTSLEKILDFLSGEIEQLGLQLAHLELVQFEYTNEDQSQLYRMALEDTKEHTKKLKSEISELKKLIAQLKKKICNRFKVAAL